MNLTTQIGVTILAMIFVPLIVSIYIVLVWIVIESIREKDWGMLVAGLFFSLMLIGFTLALIGLAL